MDLSPYFLWHGQSQILCIDAKNSWNMPEKLFKRTTDTATTRILCCGQSSELEVDSWLWQVERKQELCSILKEQRDAEFGELVHCTPKLIQPSRTT